MLAMCRECRRRRYSPLVISSYVANITPMTAVDVAPKKQYAHQEGRCRDTACRKRYAFSEERLGTAIITIRYLCRKRYAFSEERLGTAIITIRYLCRKFRGCAASTFRHAHSMAIWWLSARLRVRMALCHPYFILEMRRAQLPLTSA